MIERVNIDKYGLWYGCEDDPNRPERNYYGGKFPRAGLLELGLDLPDSIYTLNYEPYRSIYQFTTDYGVTINQFKTPSEHPVLEWIHNNLYRLKRMSEAQNMKHWSTDRFVTFEWDEATDTINKVDHPNKDVLVARQIMGEKRDLLPERMDELVDLLISKGLISDNDLSQMFKNDMQDIKNNKDKAKNDI